MRGFLFCCSLLAALASGAARAQAPQEIVSTDTIKLQAEDSKSFVFAQPFGKLVITNEDIAQVIPDSDRALTIRAFKPGRTYFTVYGTDGQAIYRATLIVEQTAGLVKIFGTKDQSSGKEAKDFFAYFCTSTGCGRVDPDRVPGPVKTEISRTQRNENGESSTVTQTYPGSGPEPAK